MENQSKIIELPRSLALRVAEILKEKYNIESKRNRIGIPYFKQEELDLITSLKISNPYPSVDSLEGIHLLTNLQRLEIETDGVTAHMRPRDIPSITNRDIKEISKCISLKKLSIVNQAKVGYIDVSKLKDLQSLTISHNQNLDEILGMEQLSKLRSLECYGNNRLFGIDGLDEVILQNKELGEIRLDVLLFPNAIGYNHKSGEYNREALRQIQEISEMKDSVFWNESLNDNKSIKINTNQMIQLHNKSCKILDDNIPGTAGIEDVVVGIENYLARNVKYDYEGRDHGHTHVISPIVIDGKEIRIQDGPKGGTNGAYNAIIKNTCVCEGYTRAMQYLLKLRGIHSHNVDCYAGRDTTHMAENRQEDQYTTYKLPTKGYHSIICIDDYYNYYDDPCWNACRYQKGDKSMPWILKTKEEISEDHTLSFDERVVENNHLARSRSSIEESIEKNNLFIQSRTRTSSINDTRKTMKQQIKGQIIQREEQEK